MLLYSLFVFVFGSKRYVPLLLEVIFETSDAATIYFTLDGSRPNFESSPLRLAGTREPAETLTIDETTKINWFTVDAAGNIEKNYNPFSKSKKFNSIKNNNKVKWLQDACSKLR